MENIQLDLVNQLKDLEFSNEQAEAKIEQLIKANEELEKGQAIYIGHRRDKIDMQLAKWVNHKFPEKGRMKIMFLRESEGVYYFGQRRVHVKIERGDQIFVRVGGGYMHIDEFINTYTDSEVEKYERRDVMLRFQNKAAIQNIVAHESTGARESSPVREKQRAASPYKSRPQSPTKRPKSASKYSSNRK